MAFWDGWRSPSPPPHWARGPRRPAASFYATLVLPAWAPPAGVFGPAWTLLYAMMAIAAWLVWRERGWRGARPALWLYLVQLAINALWSWLFFGWKLGALAFADIPGTGGAGVRDDARVRARPHDGSRTAAALSGLDLLRLGAQLRSLACQPRAAVIARRIAYAWATTCGRQFLNSAGLNACCPQPVGQRTTRADEWLTRPCPFFGLEHRLAGQATGHQRIQVQQPPLAGSCRASTSSSSNWQLSPACGTA